MIPYNQAYLTGKEIQYISEAHERGQLAGDGYFTKMCQSWLEETTGSRKSLLTHSCTAALEMAAILTDIKEGDEVIMPSFTFVSTANAFVLRGAVPVFVDIRKDTLNINEELVEEAISPKTKAIVAVHYAGVSCNMNRLIEIGRKHSLLIIEDAAQGILATYQGKQLGAIGDIGCYSFHETKNIVSGEGGALLINNPLFTQRADHVREKGTNRSHFLKGNADKYTWIDIGSSFLPGEVVAAFLYAQLQEAKVITSRRLSVWDRYERELKDLEVAGRISRRQIPEDCIHNAHIFEIILNSASEQTKFISDMNRQGINCVFHYVPLHSSPAGRSFGAARGELPVTTKISETLVRLPLWIGMDEFQDRVIDATRLWLKNN